MRFFLTNKNNRYLQNICILLPVFCCPLPSIWVPFPASHSPLMHYSHTKYVCTIVTLQQVSLTIIFSYFVSSVFHALFHMLPSMWFTSCEHFSNYFLAPSIHSYVEVICSNCFPYQQGLLLTHSPPKIKNEMQL